MLIGQNWSNETHWFINIISWNGPETTQKTGAKNWRNAIVMTNVSFNYWFVESMLNRLGKRQAF